MINTRNKIRYQHVSKLDTQGESFERVNQFKYLGSILTDDNNISEEVRSRVTSGNKCFFALSNVFKSKIINRKLKITAFNTILKPIVMYGSECWTLTTKDEEFLRAWERKILRKIYGPKQLDGQWRIRTNEELYQLYQKPDIIKEIKSKRLRWLGHVERMPEDRAAKKVWKGRQEGQRKSGRPRNRWMDEVEKDL